jgi:hypothetical protein
VIEISEDEAMKHPEAFEVIGVDEIAGKTCGSPS